MENYIGVLPDTRSEELKAKDWRAEEIASGDAMIPKFRTVKEGKWKKYTVRDQDGSGSCVSQALAKNFEVLRKINKGDTVMFSSVPIYQKRANKPNAGMNGANALDIAVKSGTCREKDCPSQKMNDAQMDSAVIPANFEDLNNDVDAIASVILPLDFDYVASAIEKWGVVMIHIAADRKSWSKDFPSLGSKSRGIRHAIAGVDAFKFNKVEYILVEDSWGEFGKFKGQRLISREVFNDMITFAGALTVFKFDVKDVAKFAPFNTVMEFEQTSIEIARLQEYLKGKGCFPSNQQATGYYGNITALAVQSFQTKFNVATPVEIASLKGKRVGAKTLAVINQNL